MRSIPWFICVVFIGTACHAIDRLRPLKGVVNEDEVPTEELLQLEVPAGILQEALAVGFRTSEEFADRERRDQLLRPTTTTVLTVTTTGTLVSGTQMPTTPQVPRTEVDVDDGAKLLFSFRLAEVESKRASGCVGVSLLEASKHIAASQNLSAPVARRTLGMLNNLINDDFCERMLPQRCTIGKSISLHCPTDMPYRTIDGTCNNLQNPTWGSAGIPFVRYLSPAYENGVDTMRGEIALGISRLPSARTVSARVHLAHQLPPNTAITLLLMQWGQFLDHDIDHTPEAATESIYGGTLPVTCCNDGQPSPQDLQPPHDCKRIDVSSDPLYATHGKSCMRFVRSLVADQGCRLGPREQLNQITAYIDGSAVYGSSETVANSLRTGSGGNLVKTPKVANAHGYLLPEEPCEHGVGTCFKGGDVRVNEQPGLASMHTLWLRVHEHLVTKFAELNPHWSDEKLYQEARKVVGALIQQITYREFLSVVLGKFRLLHLDLLPTAGLADTYDPTEDASVANVFASAAYRFGHTLVHDLVTGSAGYGLPLKDHFFKTDVLRDPQTNPSQLLGSLAESKSEGVDSYLSPTLTNHLFQGESESVGFDLMALNIQRGRDHGLPAYNEWRKACGLTVIQSFAHLNTTMTPSVADAFRTLYQTVDDIDLFPAGLAEYVTSDGIVGPTFSCILEQQFSSLKKGDRYWYENTEQPHPFTSAQLWALRKVTLASLMCNHLDLYCLQPYPFRTPGPSNKVKLCSKYPQINLEPWREHGSPVGICEGVGVWKILPGIEDWCNVNCLQSEPPHCPHEYCRCY